MTSLSLLGKLSPFPAETKIFTIDDVAFPDEPIVLTDEPSRIPESKALTKSLWRCSWKRISAEVAAATAVLVGVLQLERQANLATALAAAEQRLTQAAVSDPWPENTTVFASTLQNADAHMADYGGSILGLFRENEMLYTTALLGLLRDEKVRSLRDAHAVLEATGIAAFLRPTIQLPISSQERAGGWSKDHDRPRRVLIISGSGSEARAGEGVNDRAIFLNAATKMSAALGDLYRLDEQQVLRLDMPTTEDLERVFAELSEQCADEEGAELLIYVAAHGDTLTTSAVQGLNEGALVLRSDQCIEEGVLKELVRRYLGNFAEVSFVLDSCSSGSWIA